MPTPSRFVDLVRPAIEHMTAFRFHTLARLLVSFVPLIEMLHRHGLSPTQIGSFGSGSSTHEVLLSLIYPEAEVACFDRSRGYLPAVNRDYIDDSRQMTFVEQPLETLSWETYAESFDFVFSIQTLEHLEDPESALTNLALTVRSGGLIYVDTPYYSERSDVDTPEYLRKERERQWKKHEHHHLGFALPRVRARLEARGFQLIDDGYSSYRRGENALLRLLRQDATKDHHVSAEGALGMVLLYREILRASEDAQARSGESMDTVPHVDRGAYAIRSLARKVS